MRSRGSARRTRSRGGVCRGSATPLANGLFHHIDVVVELVAGRCVDEQIACPKPHRRQRRPAPGGRVGRHVRIARIARNVHGIRGNDSIAHIVVSKSPHRIAGIIPTGVRELDDRIVVKNRIVVDPTTRDCNKIATGAYATAPLKSRRAATRASRTECPRLRRLPSTRRTVASIVEAMRRAYCGRRTNQCHRARIAATRSANYVRVIGDADCSERVIAGHSDHRPIVVGSVGPNDRALTNARTDVNVVLFWSRTSAWMTHSGSRAKPRQINVIGFGELVFIAVEECDWPEVGKPIRITPMRNLLIARARLLVGFIGRDWTCSFGRTTFAPPRRVRRRALRYPCACSRGTESNIRQLDRG